MATESDLSFGVSAVHLGLITVAEFTTALQTVDAQEAATLEEALRRQCGLTAADCAQIRDLVNSGIRTGRSRASNPERTINDLQLTDTIAMSSGDIDAGHHLSGDSPSAFTQTLAGSSIPPGLDSSQDDFVLSTDEDPDNPVVRPEGSPYIVKKLHAEGGLSRIWVAQDDRLGREVALKQIRAELLHDTAAVARFRREAQITGQLEHPHIVPVYELPNQRKEELHYYTMRLVHGRTLREASDQYHSDRLSGHDRPVEQHRLLQCLVDVCHAVAFAHSRGVIHRDLKPENVVLGPYGEVVVLDWGLAFVRSEPDEDSARGGSASDHRDLPEVAQADANSTAGLVRSGHIDRTQDGVIMGTPAYMAPEQVDRSIGPIDERTDVFALGMTLFVILTGQLPRRGGLSMSDTLQRIANDSIDSPRSLNPHVPRSLAAICLRATARRPEERYATADELARDLQHYLAGEPVAAFPEPWHHRLQRWVRRHRLLVTAAGILLLTTSLGLLAGNVVLRREQERTLSARNDAQVLAARMMFDRGLLLCQQGQTSAGLLWQARSLKSLPAGQASLERVMRQSIASWSTQVVPLHGIITDQTPTTAISFDSTGEALIAAGRDGGLRLWRIADEAWIGQQIRHPAEIREVVSLSGSRVLTLDSHDCIHCWDFMTGQCVAGPLSAGSVVSTLHIDPSESVVLAGCNDGSGHLWDLRTGQPVSVPFRHPTQIMAAAFSPDGSCLATGDASSMAQLRDLTGAIISPPLAHGDWVTDMEFSPDGLWMATASQDRIVRLWNVARCRAALTSSPTEPLTADLQFQHSNQTRMVRFSPDGRLLLTGGADKTIRVWEPHAQREHCPPLRHDGNPTHAEFTPDGQMIVTAATDNVVRFWNTEFGHPVLPDIKHGAGLSSVKISPDGHWMASLEQSGRTSLYRIHSENRPVELVHATSVYCVEFDDARNRLFAGAAEQGNSLLEWDLSLKTPGNRRFPNSGFTFAIARAPRTGRIVSGGTQSWIRFWDPVSGTEARPGIPGRSPITAIAISPDERYVARVGWDDLVVVYDFESGQPVGPDRPQPRGRAVVFDPSNPERFAAGGRDGIVRIWNSLHTSEPNLTLPHPGQVRGVAFSADGSLLASACQDGFVRIWDSHSGQPRGTALRHDGAVNAVCFSPDSQLLATACDDGTARIWDIVEHREAQATMSHSAPVVAVRFNTKGNRLATASQDQVVRLWTLVPPANGDIDRIQREVEVLVAMQLDDAGNLLTLDRESWEKRRADP